MGFESSDPLDDIDRRLVVELQANARLPYSELARRVGLTPPAVAERIHRLQEAGVILGYAARIDPAKLGFPITAFVRIHSKAAARDEIGETLPELQEVLECHRVTGTDCFVLRVAVRSVEHLQEVIDRLMPYGDTITSIVLSSPVAHRVVQPLSAERREPHRATG
jgi:Lrp/AsnC family leucine-responsive transcriptional regulator